MNKKQLSIALLSGFLLTSVFVKPAKAANTPATISDIFVSTTKQTNALAPYEPASGVYLGMFVADGLTDTLAQQEMTSKNIKNPNNMPLGIELKYASQFYGKQPAMYLTFSNFYRPFPSQFAQNVKALGGAIQIGWQPETTVNGQIKSLPYLFGNAHISETKKYIHDFVAAAKASGVPVFLRYACEMNGSWAPWHSDTTNGKPNFSLYKKAWKIVWQEVHNQNAKNVVMVFSPDEIGTSKAERDEIMNFYPGDPYVDWIGESIYAFPYDPFKGVINVDHHMVNNFEPLYDLFASHRKPFMISEGGAVSALPEHWIPHDPTLQKQKDYENWALGQITEFFNIIPKKFPLVKSITYFNESMARANASSNDQNINYNLYENHPRILEAYKRMVSDDLFLSKVSDTTNLATGNRAFVPVQNAGALKGVHTVTPFVKLPNGQIPSTVKAEQNGKVLSSTTSSPWNFSIDFSKVDPVFPFSIKAFDNHGTLLASGVFQTKPTVGKRIYVSQRTNLYRSASYSSSTGGTIAPQKVYVLALKNNWVKIQTYLGPMWIYIPYLIR